MRSFLGLAVLVVLAILLTASNASAFFCKHGSRASTQAAGCAGATRTACAGAPQATGCAGATRTACVGTQSACAGRVGLFRARAEGSVVRTRTRTVERGVRTVSAGCPTCDAPMMNAAPQAPKTMPDPAKTPAKK